jgi:hypothetical protein
MQPPTMPPPPITHLPSPTPPPPANLSTNPCLCRFQFIVLAASGGTLACYLIAAASHGAVIALMMVLVQYLYLMPTYINIFSMFSFCNMHDISWGTKEGTC